MSLIIKATPNRIFHALVITIVLGTFNSPAKSDALLAIQPQIQQNTEWCWATVAEMVFEYYKVPDIGYGGDFQCGIVAFYDAQYNPYTGQWSGPCMADCFLCNLPAGSFQAVQGVLLQYPSIANSFAHSRSLPIGSTEYPGTLPPDQVVRELDKGRPIIAGVAPSTPDFTGPPTHVVLIVGYTVDISGILYLYVNDPLPYAILLPPGQHDPYEAANGVSMGNGQYKIEYQDFVLGLSWSQSAYGIAPLPPPQSGTGSSEISVYELIVLAIAVAIHAKRCVYT